MSTRSSAEHRATYQSHSDDDDSAQLEHAVEDKLDHKTQHRVEVNGDSKSNEFLTKFNSELRGIDDRAASGYLRIVDCLGHWTRFHSWAQEQGLNLPGDLEAALCDYLARLAEDGKRMATIRQSRVAIIKGAELAG